MRSSMTYYIISAAGLLAILSGIAISINAFGNGYPGNNYYPPNTLFFAFCLLLIHRGFVLQLGQKHAVTLKIKEVLYFFVIMSLLALVTNAAQFTPFPTIDTSILAFEASMHINYVSILSWTHAHPELQAILEWIYDTLPYQMCYFPLFVIAMGRVDNIREYYFLILVSALFGFSFYYFFPTLAPASMVSSPYFSTAQLATGLKFSQIHQHIPPTTLDGGMIALPSFHVIWAWFSLYLLRGWPLAFLLLLPINLLLVVSCVVLGWHYPTDIIGGILVIVIAHGLFYLCKKRSAWQHNELNYHALSEGL